MTTTAAQAPGLDEPRARSPRRILARGELPERRPDLPPRQSPPARAAEAGAHQAAPAGSLRDGARAQPGLRPPQPRHPQPRPRTRCTSTGPGHGGPGLVANAYLEGTYTEVYPMRDAATSTACGSLFRQFSFPGGIPSHVAPETPGPSTRAASSGTRWSTRTVRPSTTPTCSWPASSVTARPRPDRWRRAGTRTSGSNPVGDGAVLPILHLNGYKIANPTVLARIAEERAGSMLEGSATRSSRRRR